MSDLEGRRPLKVRDAGPAQATAAWLARRSITPNQISVASVFFAAIAAWLMVQMPEQGGWQTWGYPLLAAFAIQCRLLCNLFDGMVAVEGGKGTKSGELFNDIPDRIADPLILVAAGYTVTSLDYGVDLGWMAGLLSVMTAYVRNLVVALGAPSDFRGPMAKQHRMALMTGALVLMPIEGYFLHSAYMMPLALGVICLGALITLWRRSVSAYKALEASDAE